MSTMCTWRNSRTIVILCAACLAAPMLPGQGSPATPPPAQPEAARQTRPQEPKRPLPYSEEEVSYANPSTPGVELAGTFTKPKKGAPSPAVLLITGAGPQDRDETTAGHKPFLVLSDYLTRQDVAVLRVDDRGVGKSTGTFENSTLKDFATDAEAGFRYLLTRPDVDHKRIGLIGHGEGAIVAGMVAASTPGIGFLVLLNGTAVPGEKVLLAQTSRAQRAAGLPEEQVEADYRIGTGIYKMVEQGRSGADIRQALANAPENYAPYLESWRRQIPRLESPWLRYFLTYNPSSDLDKVQCPVLAIFGAKDMTIDPEQNASAMKSTFSHAHNKRAKVKVFANLNYLLQKADTGWGREYETIQETMSPEALEAIGNWISKESE